MMNHAWLKITLIDLNPVELKYYLVMISLDKCTRSYNVLSPKMLVPKKRIKKMLKHLI